VIELERGVADKLRRLRVQVRIAEPETVLLRRVPINRRYYNKPQTNVLIKSPQEGAPFLVCVDEDLEYIGTDTALTRAFVGAPRLQGWRVLHLGAGSADTAVGSALTALGFDGEEPSIESLAGGIQRSHGLLNGFGCNLSRRAREATAEPSVGRVDEIEELLATILQRRPRLPVIVGEPGVGKTNLLHGAARRVVDRRPEMDLLVVDLGVLFAGSLSGAVRESLLASLLTEAAETGRAVALERLDLALTEAPHGGFLLAHALYNGTRLIGTTLPYSLPVFEILPLAPHVQAVEVAEPPLARAVEMLAVQREGVSRHNRVTIPEALLEPTIELACGLAGHLPGKAVALLDAAAARCALANKTELDLYHVYLAADRSAASRT
jgi:hypothetical protein